MHKIVLATALCLALPAAFADSLATDKASAGPRDGLMHATLVVPAPTAAQRTSEQGVVKAALKQDKQSPPPAPAEESHPEAAMLLAALALMVGIALRRWSGSRP